MEFKNIPAIVTGGASGLGYGMVQHILAHGGKVGVVDLPNAQVEEKISALGDRACFLGADITDPEQVESAIQEAVERFGEIRLTVSCAGVASAAKTLHSGKASPLKIFSKNVHVNLTGTFNVCRLAAQAMAENQPNQDGERGVLINTASIAAFDGQMGQTAYAASKGGIVSLTLPLARDLASHGIRVVTIAPGIFDTPMLAQLPEEVRKSLGQQAPFPKRLGEPVEYAKLAQQIVENPMLNGEVIRLDGALRMGIK